MKDVYDILRETRERPATSFTLATLVRAQGSSYRRPGARLLVCSDGRTVGSLSGGCLEEEVALHAREVARTGVPALLSFDTRRRFGCNGSIAVFIERLPANFFHQIQAELTARRVCFVETRFESQNDTSPLGSNVVNDSAVVDRRYILDPGVLVQEIEPPLRLFVIGDGPDSEPVKRLGGLLGWQIITMPDATGLTILPDRCTAALVKSHNYGRDFASLRALLPLNLRYVGLVGPRRRRDQLLNDLLDVGIPINAGFFAPAGLDLGSATPEEITFAIVAEIQRVFSGTTGESLRERRVPIHAAIDSANESGCLAPAP